MLISHDFGNRVRWVACFVFWCFAVWIYELVVRHKRSLLMELEVCSEMPRWTARSLRQLSLSEDLLPAPSNVTSTSRPLFTTSSCFISFMSLRGIWCHLVDAFSTGCVRIVTPVRTQPLALHAGSANSSPQGLSSLLPAFVWPRS